MDGAASPTRPGCSAGWHEKITQHAPHATSSGTKLTLREPRGATCGTKLAQREPHGGISDTKLTPREPGGGIIGIKLALHAQNGLIWRVLLSLGEFFPFLSPTSRAGRILSRTSPNPVAGTKETTPQHNTPSRAVKHLPPQHATNNPKSPIFTTQGRTFFQPPASRPSQPTVACNSTPPHPTTTA